MSNIPLLQMNNIMKSFGSNVVLDDVSISLDKGHVLGLIGENGAGKSTLIKILCGIYTKDSGEIKINGETVNINDASIAQQLGISTIYQELSVMPDLSAVQNVFINREQVKGGHLKLISPLSEKEMESVTKGILYDQLGMTEIPLRKPTRNFPLAQKQMIEIARTVFANAKIIIMDEPTAALQEKEREKLFSVIRQLKSRGKAIIFISHHLDELMDICDDIVVLRDGHKVADGRKEDFSIDKIITHMVGRSIESQYVRAEDKTIGNVILKVNNLTLENKYSDISFELKKGEVLGFVGVEGCGKNEVLRSLFGVLKPESGSIEINGKKLSANGVKDAMDARVAFVPAERKTEGLFLKQSVAWNTTIATLDKIRKHGFLNNMMETEITEGYIRSLNIKTSGLKQNIARLSGGNQQKVMLARWILNDADVYLFEEPTRGIDVGAKTEVYKAIADLVRAGKGVIVVSSEEEEVMGICDRIIVMRNGMINARLDAFNTSETEIKQYSYKG